MNLVFIGNNTEAQRLIQEFVNTAFPNHNPASPHVKDLVGTWYDRFFTGGHATLRHAVVNKQGDTLVVDVDQLNAATYRRLKWWDKHKAPINELANLVPELVWNRIPDAYSMRPYSPERRVTTQDIPKTSRFFVDFHDIRAGRFSPACGPDESWAIDVADGKIYQRIEDHVWKVYPGL